MAVNFQRPRFNFGDVIAEIVDRESKEKLSREQLASEEKYRVATLGQDQARLEENRRQFEESAKYQREKDASELAPPEEANAIWNALRSRLSPDSSLSPAPESDKTGIPKVEAGSPVVGGGTWDDVRGHIAKFESGGKADSTNLNKNGTQDTGLYQINDVNIDRKSEGYGPDFQAWREDYFSKLGIGQSLGERREALKNPVVNEEFGKRLFLEKGLQPWSTADKVRAAMRTPSASNSDQTEGKADFQFTKPVPYARLQGLASVYASLENARTAAESRKLIQEERSALALQLANIKAAAEARKANEKDPASERAKAYAEFKGFLKVGEDMPSLELESLTHPNNERSIFGKLEGTVTGAIGELFSGQPYASILKEAARYAEPTYTQEEVFKRNAKPALEVGDRALEFIGATDRVLTSGHEVPTSLFAQGQIIGNQLNFATSYKAPQEGRPEYDPSKYFSPKVLSKMKKIQEHLSNALLAIIADQNLKIQMAGQKQAAENQANLEYQRALFDIKNANK